MMTRDGHDSNIPFLLTSTCFRRLDSEFENAETLFLGTQSKLENFTLFSVFPLYWNMVRKFGHGPGSLSSRSTFAALSMTEYQFAKCAENLCTAASDQKKNPVITASERRSLDGDDHLSKCHKENVALVGKRHCGKRALTAVEDRNMNVMKKSNSKVTE